MNSGGMSDRLREAMEQKGREDSGTLMGQFASTVRREQADDGEMKEFVWVNKGEELDMNAPDDVWQQTPGSFKVYGNWNEYAQGQDDEGNMFLADDDFPYIRNAEGQFVLDESTYEGRSRSDEMGRQELGGQGASPMEDLMEKLGQMRGAGGAPAPGRKMAMGGRIGGGGGEADSDDALIVGDRRRYRGGGRIYKAGGKFPDLNKDGKVTFADILMGRGVKR